MSKIWQQPGYNAQDDPDNLFGFVPNLAAALVFLISFALLSIAHLAFTVKSRIPWMICISIGGLSEVLGWIGRLWGHYNPQNLNAYLLQQVCLAIAPVFFSAICYALFTKLVFIISPSLSRFPPKYYTPVFVVLDVICLTIQAVGGGQSGAAASDDGPDQQTKAERGGHIYLGGVAVQLLVMILFAILALDYANRVRRAVRAGGSAERKGVDEGTGPIHGNDTALGWENVNHRGVKTLVWGIGIASGLIIFRNIFRTIELAQGYDGYLAVHEAFITTLDSAPMVLTMLVLLISHPAITLRKLSDAKLSTLEPRRSSEASTVIGGSPLSEKDRSVVEKPFNGSNPV